jgi:hypothetical protein
LNQTEPGWLGYVVGAPRQRYETNDPHAPLARRPKATEAVNLRGFAANAR